MVQARSGNGLAVHPRALGVVSLARHHLDGHMALELLVVRPPDHAEPSRPDAALEAVTPEHDTAPASGPGASRAQPTVRSVSGGVVLSGVLIWLLSFGPVWGLPAPDAQGQKDNRTGGHTPHLERGAILSFFDEPDQPAARARSGRRSPPVGPPTDRQTLIVRRGIAVGAGVLLLVLLVFGVRGCLDSRKERAFKDYVRDVGTLVQESNQESDALFELLKNPDVEDVDIENQLNTSRNQAGQLVDRARGTDHPDELDAAHAYLVETLEFRRDGVSQIASELPNAIASQADRRTGTDKIAASMQNFLTSDVIYQTRVVPNINRELEDQDIDGEEKVPSSTFLEDIAWLQPSTVADRVGVLGGLGSADGNASPGLHGNGLGTVTLGGRDHAGQLAEHQALRRPQVHRPGGQPGENTETDVQVNIAVGQGGDAIKLDKPLDTIAAGETKTVEIRSQTLPRRARTCRSRWRSRGSRARRSSTTTRVLRRHLHTLTGARVASVG